MLRVVLGLGLTLAATVGHTQPPPFEARQREAIEAIVRDYLLKNPEVLQDSLAELERRRQEARKVAQAAALRGERERLTAAPDAYMIGNPAGDVTLVEFFDYNCSHCRKASGDVGALIETDPGLRVVLKDFPVLGPDSIEASRAALAAKEQLPAGKLAAFHARLMQTRGRLNGEGVLAVAKEFGLGAAKLQEDMWGQKVTAALRENLELGEKLGIDGTPAFVLRDEIIPGAVGVEPLRRSVSRVRRCGDAAC